MEQGYRLPRLGVPLRPCPPLEFHSRQDAPSAQNGRSEHSLGETLAELPILCHDSPDSRALSCQHLRRGAFQRISRQARERRKAFSGAPHAPPLPLRPWESGRRQPPPTVRPLPGKKAPPSP